MQKEMIAQEQNETWDLVSLHPGKQANGCQWVYNNPDGSLAHLKARLVTERYSQIYDIDYQETSSHVTTLTSVRFLISFVAIHRWPLHQLDIKNAFFHSILDEEVYMEQPRSFVTQREVGQIVIS